MEYKYYTVYVYLLRRHSCHDDGGGGDNVGDVNLHTFHISKQTDLMNHQLNEYVAQRMRPKIIPNISVTISFATT